MNFNLLTLILILFHGIIYVSAHECYVCKDQEDNKGKCVTTVKPCDFGEDTCLSEIRWGSAPYWQIGAPMQHFISKRCATQDECHATVLKYMDRCPRIWWKDWHCAECCKGDRCNYYITTGSSSTDSSLRLITIGLFMAVARYIGF